jgi:hypothetical protein
MSVSCQVQGLLRRVRPEWTEGHFELLEYTTHGDKEKTEQLRTLGQGAFTGMHAQASKMPQLILLVLLQLVHASHKSRPCACRPLGYMNSSRARLKTQQH